MAQLRAQRLALYQQRQAEWQQYYTWQSYLQQQQGAVAGAKQGTMRKEVDIRIEGDGTVYDTIASFDPETYEMTEIVRARRTDTGNRTAGNDPNVQREMDDLRRRLDRQEDLLLEIRDNSYVTPAAAPMKRDTVVQRILTNNNPNQLTREDLRRLSDEVGNLNGEISRLQNRLADEEKRRERAEDRMQDILRDNRDYTRDLSRDIDQRDRRDRLTIRPDVVVDRAPRPEPKTIRDTVYVDRVTIPENTVDTLIQVVEVVKEVTPEPRIVRDTVKEEVVRTETVQLAAKEPIGFPTVFFDNNSAVLNTTHRNILSSMIEEMQDKGSYRVRLTGYASKSGNADYNQQLSARRAEAVKQGLLEMGIPESRIRMVAGGIDFQASTPAAGRRVEVQAIPQ